MLNGIEKLSPFIVPKPWGGTKLGKRVSHHTKGMPIGELLEVSRLENRDSWCTQGRLGTIIQNPLELPYLVKYIDANENLSIQVHPDDDYALKIEQSAGKTECWLILEAWENGGIYLGFQEGLEKKHFAKLIKEGKDVDSCLNFYPVSRGDFITVPAGTIHAIGKGVLLLEIQQSSGITYRVWDWNRVDKEGRPRPLHLHKALDVLNFRQECNQKSFFEFKQDIFSTKINELMSFKDFIVTSFNLKKGEKMSWTCPLNGRYRSLFVLKGNVLLSESEEKMNKYSPAECYETYLIHKDVQKIEIHCLQDAELVLVF